MKHITRRKSAALLALALSLALCGGLLAGCSSGDDTQPSQTVSAVPEESEEPAVTQEPEQSDDTGDDAAEEEESGQDGAAGELVAQVTGVAEDGTLTLAVYELTQEAAGYVITDHAAVELGNYQDSGVSQTYLPQETDTVQAASDGLLTSAAAEDIAVGDMVVIYADAAGNQIIVIYTAGEGQE